MHTLKAKFIPDDNERKELWTLALLRAFKKFDDLKDNTLTIEEQEQKFGEDLLAAVAATILDPKELECRQFEERYIAMKRERGDDLFQTLVKENKLFAKAKVKGYKLDPSTQKRTLEKMCLDKEWLDGVRRAASELKKESDALMYAEICPRLVEDAKIFHGKRVGRQVEESSKPDPTSQAPGVFWGGRGTSPSGPSGSRCSSGGFVYRGEKCPAKNATYGMKDMPRCGEKGHFVSCCPKKRQRGREAAGAAIPRVSGTTFDMRKGDEWDEMSSSSASLGLGIDGRKEQEIPSRESDGDFWVGWDADDNRTDGVVGSDDALSDHVDAEGELPPVDLTRGVRSSVLKGVLARESNGALFPAQIVREGEQQLRGASIARLKKQEDSSFRLAEFDRIAQKDIVERFDLPAEGRLPESIL
uniref:Uncharacterized protein n=1 Tax=Chromera velia CCMP2878 TaxID=1169474 RepID=A0A0G4I4B2_9ALVE|eukprot:Cvel_10806.t1-p1 / transcript=Cvel_10806.t1 / gene=Cvel_10806 / organism=Chromera_velia_CCMP2878 / gene_product=hypothetical protein / transcript_product=hypothetical protein / location=Cvel_scaffold661:11356-14766(+) / protein_length=414 / sequence_SO=supercontig / SO=protein_coding / is_pseudo=false